MVWGDNLVELIKAIDEISEIIYVADTETYDLLYVNETGKRVFSLDKPEGRKCYRALQQRESPCPFCTNTKLTSGQNYTWEYTNPVTKRHYLLQDRLIIWDGRPARLEIAFDLSAAEKEKTDLRYALDSEKLILDCIRTLYEEKSLTQAMNLALKKIGSYLCADRAYIFHLQEDQSSDIYEWCKQGVFPQKNTLQEVSPHVLAPWMEYMKQNNCMVMEDIEAVRDTGIYHILKANGITSLVIAPLEQEGESRGYFGVDNPPVEKIRNIISLLNTLRYFIMLTFQKKEDEVLLQKLSLHDTLTGLYNRNKYILDIQTFVRSDCAVGVVYLDFNGLKEINDRHGHAQGDLALKKCTEKMRGVFPDASLYRTGGDEFIIICQSLSKTSFQNKVLELKKAMASDPLCQVAMGYEWEKAPKRLEELITRADLRMYEDKKQFYAKLGSHPACRSQGPKEEG